jgi:hypothetical protein
MERNLTHHKLDLRGTRSDRDSKLTPITSFKYIWSSSIPTSWDLIMKKKHINKLQVTKNDRNTLLFLEETQKYINNIRKPINFDQKLVFSSKTPRVSIPAQKSSLEDEKIVHMPPLRDYNRNSAIPSIDSSPLNLKTLRKSNTINHSRILIHSDTIRGLQISKNHPNSPILSKRHSHLSTLKKNGFEGLGTINGRGFT